MIDANVISSSSTERLCSTCTHLVGVRDSPYDWEKWQCGKSKIGVNVVSGKPVYVHCIAERSAHQADNHCGISGKWWEKYERPVYDLDDPQPTDIHKIPIRKKISAEDL